VEGARRRRRGRLRGAATRAPAAEHEHRLVLGQQHRRSAATRDEAHILAGLADALRQRGEIQPQRIDPLTGQPYPNPDWSVTHPEDNGDLVNVGRVPGYPEYQVFRASDGQLWVFSPQELDERIAATQAASASSKQ